MGYFRLPQATHRERSSPEHFDFVAVGVKGDGDSGVAQPFLNHLRVYVRPEQHRSVEVAQIMEPNVWSLGSRR